MRRCENHRQPNPRLPRRAHPCPSQRWRWQDRPDRCARCHLHHRQPNCRLHTPRHLARDNNDVGKKTSPNYLEGPWLIKRNGKYILFTAAPYQDPKGDLKIGYWTGVAVADHISGPYQKQPRVFLGGHVTVFTGPDGQPWWSSRGESGGDSQGKLCLTPIPFAPDGSVKPPAAP